MRGMPRAVPVLLLLAAAARADDDPAGTVRLALDVGETAPIQALPGSNVICDDVSVVAPDFAEDGGGFVLRALKPGSTRCGVWLGDQEPGGVSRVWVAA